VAPPTVCAENLETVDAPPGSGAGPARTDGSGDVVVVRWHDLMDHDEFTRDFAEERSTADSQLQIVIVPAGSGNERV
jgi:hypothetical protein